MSIFSQIVEQASATMPFDQAQPVKMYNNKEEIERQQRIAEELERELENELVSSTIEGLSDKSKPKTKKSFNEEVRHVKKKTKNKSWGNFMDEDTLPVNEESKETHSQAHKIKGLLSKLCNYSESKETRKADESGELSVKKDKKKKKKFTEKHK